MGSDFGHVVIPDRGNGSESWALAPAPEGHEDDSSNRSGVRVSVSEQPTMFDNCKVLSQKYRVRWTLRVRENLIDIGLEAATQVQNYMAFGWANPNPSSSSVYMLHSDVTVTGFTEDFVPFAEDFYVTDYTECSLGDDGVPRGVCPDSVYNTSDPNSVNNTNVVYGHRNDGVSFVRFQRQLVPVDDKYDLRINATENMTVIWAVGQIKAPDSLRPYNLPENHGGPQFVSYGHLAFNVSENVNDCLGPLDADDKDDQDLVVADAKVPLIVTSGMTHAFVGRGAILVGMMALITGMTHLGERHGDDAEGLTWALVIWFVFLGLIVFYLEYREKGQRSERGSGRGSWVIGNMDDDDSADLLGPTETQMSGRMEVQLEPVR